MYQMSKTIKVSNPGNNNDIQPVIQAAVNSALNGDIIELPAGQFILNKNVLINKFISIKGQGIGKTVIYWPESKSDSSIRQVAMFSYNINKQTSSGIIFSDMTLKSKKPSLVDGDGLSRSVDMGVEFIKCIDFIVTRCRFEYFGNGAVSVIHEDELASGLINKNEFVTNAKGYDALGLGYGVVVYGTNKKWIDDPKFGSSNFIFIEDNFFDYHRHSVAAGGAALYVFRYNTVKNNIAGNTNHAIDAHEARLDGGGNHYSTRAIEVYNNNIINTLFKDGTSKVPNGTPIVPGKNVSWLTETAICTRGGEALIYNNNIEGYRFGVALVANTIFNGPYPVEYQQGYQSAKEYGPNHSGTDGNKSKGDVFIWNNNYKSYAPTNPQCAPIYIYSPDLIKLKRDYHLEAKSNYKPYTYPHPLSKSVVVVSKLDVSVSASSVTCNGGKDGMAIATVTGGTPTSGYTYLWNTIPVQKTLMATKLSAGTYSVIVSDGTSSATTSVNVIQPEPLNITASVTINIDGGTPPFTYLWSNGQTGLTALELSAGTYTVTVTDKNACSKKISVRIK